MRLSLIIRAGRFGAAAVQAGIIVAMGVLMSSAHAASFVYVGNADSQDITVLELKPDGAMIASETVAVPGPAKPGGSLPLVISPEKDRLYAGLRNEPYSAVAFGIDAKSRRLTFIGAGPLTDSMAYLSIDRTGRFLLGASYGGNKVAIHPIGPNGVLASALQVIATEPNAHCIIFDPTNRYVLHTSLGGDVIYQQKFDAAKGTLSPNDPPTVSVKAKGGPRHLLFSPDRRFVYLLNELDAAIYVFPWNAATGTLKKETQIASALPKGFDGKPWAADIHLTPDGKFLYASERTSSTLAAFAVDATTGALAPIDSYPTEKQPRGFAIDPSGRYLLAVGQLSNSLTSYAIDRASGKLTALGQYPTGKNPNWVEIVNLP
ncbi:MAG: lactonase family protein [Tardiphaga sp.]|nr:lactonase family protein [Tardiphaga sp.]